MDNEYQIYLKLKLALDILITLTNEQKEFIQEAQTLDELTPILKTLNGQQTAHTLMVFENLTK